MNTYIYVPLDMHCNNVYIWRKITLILLAFILLNYIAIMISVFMLLQIYTSLSISATFVWEDPKINVPLHTESSLSFFELTPFPMQLYYSNFPIQHIFLSPEQTQIYSTMYNVHGSDIINIGIRYPVICHTFEGLLELSIFKLVC